MPLLQNEVIVNGLNLMGREIMNATILFPSDYFSLSSPNENYSSEFEAVISTEGLEAALFNFDEYIEGTSLVLNRGVSTLPNLLIYRGWMMSPEQYKKFYEDLGLLGFEPLTTPTCYEQMHYFPNAAKILKRQTPSYLSFPMNDGVVNVDADLINVTFDRFMIKDFVKSAKDTAFPSSVKTPISQDDLNDLVAKFIEIRGSLFVGGIVVKEYVDLKRYGGITNEWRNFCFTNGISLGLNRNSNQPSNCPVPPVELLEVCNAFDSSFYTVDYAELEDGSWTIIETGDGQVSGLAASDDPARFYRALRDALEK